MAVEDTELTILLVDSDSARRRLFTHHLARQRYLVYQAAKVAEARLLLARQRFDAVIVDQRLEDGEGLEVLREIAASGGGAEGDAKDAKDDATGKSTDEASSSALSKPPVRFYLESRWPDAATLHELTDELGVARVLQKPLTPGELSLQLEASLSGAASAPTSDLPLTGRVVAPPLPPPAIAAPASAPSATSSPTAAASSLGTEAATTSVDAIPLPRAAAAGADEPEVDVSVPESIGAVIASTRATSVETRGEPPPLPDEQDDSERELASLRDEYAKALVTKLESLQSLLSSNSTVEVTGQIQRARALAHELRNTAGSFGYMEVSAATAVVESALDDMLDGKVDRREVRVWREIDAAIERALSGARDDTPQSGQPLVRSRHTTTVLVVDEDPDLLNEVQRIGRDNLLQVLVAQSARRALSLATAHPIDGAIIDAALPFDPALDPSLARLGSRTPADVEAAEAGALDEGGLGLARALRGLEGKERLPLALVSQQGALPDRVAAAHAGATLFLTKPLVADELVQAARRFASEREVDPPRVLIVDDDDGFVAQITAVLAARRMRVEQLREPRRVLDTLERVRPDLLLLDTVLPRVSGYDICKLLRASPRWHKLPVIFLTRQTTRRARLACFEVGGDDYLQKPVLIEELLARLSARLDRVRRDRETTVLDHLTGLMTRSAFLGALEARLAESRRRARPIALALIEVDDLALINAEHGDRAGDEAIVAAGSLLRRRFRVEDLRCRWSSDELMVVFGGERADSARRILGRALVEYREQLVEGKDGAFFGPTFSAGIAAFPDDGGSVGDLVRVADERLELAKRDGGDRVIAEV